MSANGDPIPTNFSRVDPVPYVLRIGVTGHRALGDESAVRASVERLVQGIEGTLRHSAEAPRSGATSRRRIRDWFDRGLLILVKVFWWSMPITLWHVPRERQVPLKWRVISALALGADRVVADVVVNTMGGELEPVLPFVPDVYERDFDSVEDRDAFREWLDGKKEPWVATDVFEPTAEQRTTAYRLAGERVVDESDIVIAVWDGKPARGEGGTAEIVSYAILQNVPVYWIRSDDPNREPVLLRAGKNGPEAGGKIPRTAKEIAPHYHQLSAYFRDPAYRKADVQAIYERENGYLVDSAAKSGFDSDAMQRAIQHGLAQHAYADHLAIRHQSLHLRSTIAIILFAAAAVTAAAIQLLAFEEEIWIIGFEIAFMVGAAVLLRVSLREGWHEKWLYDRYLAERLRSLMFREGLGHPPSGPNSIQELLPFYEGPSAWVDLILRRDSAGDSPAKKEDDPKSLRRFLDIAWIGSQGGWHGKNVAKKEKAHRRLHFAVFALFALTLLCAVLHWFHVGHENSLIYLHGLPEVIKCLAVMLPAWGGALHGIAHLMDYSRIAQRSERMHLELGKLAHELEHAESIDAIGDIAKRADKLMAMENLEWMMTLAHCKPELHV